MEHVDTQPLPDGLFIFLGSGDMKEIDDHGEKSATLAKLLRAGAIGAVVLIESVEGTRQRVARVLHVCELLRARGITPVLMSFPSVLADVGAAIGHALECERATGARLMWDIEPRRLAADRVVHWTARGVARLRAAVPHALVTSTRIELPKLGDVDDAEVWLQLEQQTSTDTLAKVLERWPDAVCVTGVFDDEDDKRTLDEIRRDLERCTAQAKKTGRHGVWSARSMSLEEADVHREWALSTWAPPRAA